MQDSISKILNTRYFVLVDEFKLTFEKAQEMDQLKNRGRVALTALVWLKDRSSGLRVRLILVRLR